MTTTTTVAAAAASTCKMHKGCIHYCRPEIINPDSYPPTHPPAHTQTATKGRISPLSQPNAHSIPTLRFNACSMPGGRKQRFITRDIPYIHTEKRPGCPSRSKEASPTHLPQQRRWSVPIISTRYPDTLRKRKQPRSRDAGFIRIHTYTHTHARTLFLSRDGCRDAEMVI